MLPLRVTLGPGAATEATVRVAGGTVVGLPDACAREHGRAPPLLPVGGRHHPGLRRRRRAQPGARDRGPGRRRARAADGHGHRRRHRHLGPGPSGAGRAAGHPAPAAADLEPGLPERRRRRPAPGPGLLDPRPVRQLHQPGVRAGDRPRPRRLATTAAGRGAGGRRPGRRSLGSRLAPHRQLRPGRQLRPARDGGPAGGRDVLPAVPAALPRPRPRPLRRRRRPRVRRQPLDRVQAAARSGVPAAVRALLHAHAGRPSAVPRPPEGGARRDGVRVPAGAGRPGGHHRPVRHRAGPRPDQGRPAAAAVAGGGAPLRAGGRRALDHRPGPRADRSSRSARAAPASCTTRAARSLGCGRSSGSTASTSTSAARCTT